MLIRKYKPSDKEDLLVLLRLNTPLYFDPSEEKDLIDFLENEIEEYFIVVVENKIIGAGGFNLLDNKTRAAISWDFIHPDYQKKGVGSTLIYFRMNEIQKIQSVRTVSVRTSQLVYKFYEKFGFKVRETVKDYWARGLDMYRLDCEVNKIILPR